MPSSKHGAFYAPNAIVLRTAAKLPDASEAELIQRAQADDRLALDVLVARHDHDLWQLTRRFSSQHLDVDDLMQAGRIGLARQVHEYDLNHPSGASLFAFAWRAVLRAMANDVRDGRLVHLSEELSQAHAAVSAEESGTDTRKTAFGGTTKRPLDEKRRAKGEVACRVSDVQPLEASREADAACPGSDVLLNKAQVIALAMGALSPKQQELIDLIYFQGMSGVEVGLVFGGRAEKRKVAHREAVSHKYISFLRRAAEAQMREALTGAGYDHAALEI
ncbi:MAG: sigma-70 family RNA polymerase sigma factor [Patescibacteria group bacterium]|nr:sigma-70 family RNA polymerase sigma factor [Patescibacteria group bacterium]